MGPARHAVGGSPLEWSDKPSGGNRVIRPWRRLRPRLATTRAWSATVRRPCSPAPSASRWWAAGWCWRRASSSTTLATRIRRPPSSSSTPSCSPGAWSIWWCPSSWCVAFGRAFLFLFVALVAGLLVGDVRIRLDRALRTAIERATQLDETRRREAMEKERVERLEEVDKLRSDFISMVAHELQTPLASIKTQADTLLSQQHRLDQETRAALVDGIHRSAASLTGLVQDFAAVNRIENNQFTYHFERLDLTDFVKEVVDHFQADPRRHPIRVRVEPGLTVRGDRRRLQQALLNLLNNAVKYSPRGGNIAVIAFPDKEGNAKVSGHDEGIGIREEDLPKLFSKLTRRFDKRAMNIGGSGRSEEHTSELQS